MILKRRCTQIEEKSVMTLPLVQNGSEIVVRDVPTFGGRRPQLRGERKMQRFVIIKEK